MGKSSRRMGILLSHVRTVENRYSASTGTKAFHIIMRLKIWVEQFTHQLLIFTAIVSKFHYKTVRKQQAASILRRLASRDMVSI